MACRCLTVLYFPFSLSTPKSLSPSSPQPGLLLNSSLKQNQLNLRKMRLFLLAPAPFLLSGCASIGVGAFIVTPILFMAFIIACIWALVRLISGSSTKNLEREKFQHQKEMDYRAYEAAKKPPPPAYTPTLPTPSNTNNSEPSFAKSQGDSRVPLLQGRHHCWSCHLQALPKQSLS